MRRVLQFRAGPVQALPSPVSAALAVAAPFAFRGLNSDLSAGEGFSMDFALTADSVKRIQGSALLFPRMFRDAAKPNWMFGGAHRGDRWGMEAWNDVADKKVQRWDPVSIAKLRNIRGNLLG